MRQLVPVALVALALFVFVIGGVVGTSPPSASDPPLELSSVHTDPPPLGLEECAAEPPPDFADPPEDVFGWHDGVWYTEPIDVDQSDGLDDAELDLVIARTMARVEALRCLEFTDDVDVSVIDRETFIEERGTSAVSNDTRWFENAKAKALFLVNESADVVEVESSNRGTSVLGYYSIADSEIVLVSDGGSELVVDEITLAHELGHALQDQHFGFEEWGRNTTDLRQAELGLVEGDVSFVQHVYQGHCVAGAWGGECLERPDGEPGELANIGLYLISFQPYSDGPNFVAHQYEQGGWEAVNALYDGFPDSAKEIVYPERYGAFDASPPQLVDRSNDSWHQVDPTNHPGHDQLGEPVLFVSFIYPGFETEGQEFVIDPQQFFNVLPSGELDPINPYDYRHEYTEGWAGDRFMAFTRPPDEPDGEHSLGYVHRIAFESDDGAVAYLDGYEALLEFRGASPVDGLTVSGDGLLVRIDEEDDFAGAYWVHRDGSTVTVVHAPSVDELDAVYEDVAIEEATIETPTTTPVPTPTPPDEPGTTTPTSPPVDPQPGFGPTIALLAVAAVLARFARRRA